MLGCANVKRDKDLQVITAGPGGGRWSALWRWCGRGLAIGWLDHRGQAGIALRDTLQVHPCKLFVGILPPKVSHYNSRLPLKTTCVNTASVVGNAQSRSSACGLRLLPQPIANAVLQSRVVGATEGRNGPRSRLGQDAPFRSYLKEPADKPGSVVGNHSSGTIVTNDLKRPTRRHRGPRYCLPIWSCFEWGLPSRSVLPPARCALTAPFHPYLQCRRYIFCCTFRRLTPPRYYLAPCPAKPGLSSPRRTTARLPGRLRCLFSSTKTSNDSFSQI